MSRKIIPALVALAALALSACGQSGAEPAAGETTSAAPSAFPVTVEHAMGSTTVTAEPKRVVALDSSYAEATLLLESNLVGITTYRAFSTDLPEYLGEAREKYAKDVQSVGEMSAPSLEKIAALKPDLIVSAKVRHEALYGQLSKIAPTVMSETTGPTFKKNIELLGKALGKEDLAKEKLAAFEAEAKKVGEAVNAKAGNPTISITRFNDGPTRLYLPASYSGIVLADAGLARPQPQQAEGFILEISEENIKQADADKIFVSTYEDEAGLAKKTKEAFEANPLWKPLQPKVVEVSDSTWMTAVSIQGAYHILADIAKAFGVEGPAPLES